MSPAHRLLVIDDCVPEETLDCLRLACKARSVEYLCIDATSFTYGDCVTPQAGDLLYRPAVSDAAMSVEQYLLCADMATLYRRRDGAFYDLINATLRFCQLGLPVPNVIPLNTLDRELLLRFLARVGGPPAVLKVPGYSGGLGVMRVDSEAAFLSLAEFLTTSGRRPELSAYVEGATHWRCVVLDDQVLTAYKNPVQSGDFRSHSSEDPGDYCEQPHPVLVQLATKAALAVDSYFAGVDILEHASGRYYVLEANFPCYFANVTEVAEIDVAGPVLDFLIRRSAELY